MAALRAKVAWGFRVRISRAMHLLFALAAVGSFAAMMPTAAMAQFVCTGPAPETICTITGDLTATPSASFLTSAVGGENATTVNTAAGVVDDITTQASTGNALTQNSGTVFDFIETFTTAGGNATIINSYSDPFFFLELNAHTDAGGDATTNNSGAVFGIITQTSNMGLGTGAGKATSINSGSTDFIQTSTEDGGNAVTVNSGKVFNSFSANFFPPFLFPGIVTATSDGGDATTINTGTVGGGFFGSGIVTATGLNGGDGNATTINRGVVNGEVTTTTGTSGTGTGNATLINYGTIDTTSARFTGGGFVDTGALGGIASVYNAGKIIGEVGVFSSTGGSASLSNAGFIDGSYSGVAVNISQSLPFSITPDPTIPTTLNILPGSRILGSILLNGIVGAPGSTPTAVNFFAGHDISSVTSFGGFLSCGCGGGAFFGGLTDTGAPVNVFGGAPYVINGNTVAILDPTSFAVADRNVVDFSHTVSTLFTNRLNNPTSTSGNGSTAIGFAPSGNVAVDMARDAFAGISSLNYASTDRVLFSNPSFTAKDGTSIWAQGFGGQRIQGANAPTLRSVNNFYGGAMGIDKAVRPDLRMGVLAGAGKINSNIDVNSGSTSSDVAFAGVYGRYAMNRSFVDFALLGGHSNNDVRRNIANNLVAGGLETASAKYDGWFISPEFAYGVRMPVAANLTLTPTARVRYLAAEFDGYQETGSTTNLNVASRTSHNFEERAEVTLTKTSDPLPTQRMQISGTVGLLALQRVGDTTVNTVLLGQNLPFATPGKNDVFGGFAGVGFDWRHISGWTVFGAAEYTATTDSSQTVSGKGGVKVAF